MKTFLASILCLLVALLPACNGFFTPQQRGNAHAAVDDAEARHDITAKQAAAMHEAIDNDEPVDWTAYGFLGLSILSGLLGGPAIVRYQRGKPTQKVGLPASKIVQPG